MPTAPEPKDVRDAYSEYMNEWADIREESSVDRRYAAGDPWDKQDRLKREEAGRPCISLDELNQYLNQYNNTLRQNKRAIQVIPKGSGANDEDATRRENIIRGIENECNAQEAYITMAENAAMSSYGYLLLGTAYRDDVADDEEADERLFEQKITITRVANPDMILLNPGFEKADASDVEDGFVLKRIKRAEFSRKYPNADKQSFTPDDLRQAKDWISEKDLQIAEYWKIHKTPKKLLLLRHKQEGQEILVPVWADDLEGRKPPKDEVARERMVEIKKVVQYITNGLEILDEIDWMGSRIPIISCFGKELWLDEGSGAKRKLLSMIRLARDPQMLFAYMCTQEAEEAKMTPKSPFMGAKGQFESARASWEMILEQPFAFIEYDTVLDAAANGGALPPPARLPWSPNFQSYEIAKDSIRRSIQAAMGISPLPTAAQRDSEKSGVALERISTQESIGSFHFTDNFDRALQNLGWQVNELITPIYDTAREVPVQKADGKSAVLQIIGNSSHPLKDDGAYELQGLPANQDGSPVEHLHTGKGEFDVTISTGPSYQSQREQASEFVDHLIANWQQLGIPAPLAQKILALGIKLKDIGPIGDAIQELLDPPSDMSQWPPAAQAQFSQLQAQLQALQTENAALHQDRAARVLEQQTKLQLKDKEIAAKGAADAADHMVRMSEADKDRETKLEVAEIGTKAQSLQERLKLFNDLVKQFHDQAHDLGMLAQQHAQGMEMAQQNAATQAQSQAADQSFQAQQAQGGAPAAPAQ
jgi:Phage P22-like portal protein